MTQTEAAELEFKRRFGVLALVCDSAAAKPPGEALLVAALERYQERWEAWNAREQNPLRSYNMELYESGSGFRRTLFGLDKGSLWHWYYSDAHHPWVESVAPIVGAALLHEELRGNVVELVRVIRRIEELTPPYVEPRR